MLMLGSFGGAASAYTVEVAFFIDGIDLDLGEVYHDSSTVIVVFGDLSKLEDFVKPPFDFTDFKPEVDFHFECDPTNCMTLVFDLEMENQPKITGFRVLDTLVGPVTDWETDFSNPVPFDINDVIAFRLAGDDYLALSIVEQKGLTLQVAIEDVKVPSSVPKPTTLLLLGAGLLGLVGFRRRRRNNSRLKTLVIAAMLGGLLLSGAQRGAAQSMFDCSAPNQTQIPQSECEVLVALYNSTNGNNWLSTQNNNFPWLTTNMPCSWAGVACEDGHVAQLWLQHNNLVGSLPPEIGNPGYLKVLRLHVNHLNGSLPSELGNLSNLQVLYLAENGFSGAIPAEIGKMYTCRHPAPG